MPQTIKEVNDKLVQAGRLEYRPIYVYGTDETPRGAYQVSTVITKGHRCLAKSLLKMAINEDVPPVYVGKGHLEGCCFGAASTLGFTPFPPMMRDLMSAESKSGESMFLKASDDICDRTIESLGRITPPGNFVVMSPASEIDESAHKVLSVLCFGTAEQIRNLCGLIHFGISDPFSPVIAPWGPHCAIFVAYPAGMAEKAPKNTAFIGPTEPDGNDWFPPDLLSLSMPIGIARRISENCDASFAGKKPEIAFPMTREKL
jgi:hypothetical protein